MNRVIVAVLSLILIVGAVWYFFARSYEITNYPPKNSVIVAFGDSLISGVGSDTGGFVSLLSQMSGVKIINLGLPGDTTESGYARLDTVKAEHAGIILVLLGGNDALRKIPIETTFSNLEKIVTELQADGSIVILLGVRGGLLNDPYEDKYSELAERTGSAYVSNVLKGLLTHPELMADGIHPNDKGYAIMADRIYETLKPLLK